VFIYLGLQVSGDATLQVDHFTFSPSIAENMRTASLVISHAGNYSFQMVENRKVLEYFLG
jgi:beta-1,4-N-acetylglucosaminyltransferase